MEIGFGPLDLPVDVFWSLTPVEILRLFDGWQWRDERESRRVAGQTANLLNVHLQPGDRVTVDQLLGLEQPEPEVDKEEEFAKLMDLIEEQKRTGAATL